MEQMRVDDLVKGTKYLFYHSFRKEWRVGTYYKNGPERYFFTKGDWDWSEFEKTNITHDTVIYSLPLLPA